MFTKMEYDRVLNCLTRISLYYPPFINQFFLQIFTITPKLNGNFINDKSC